MSAPVELLFTYGSLQQPRVQLDTFGRVLRTEPDALPGYRVAHVEETPGEQLADRTGHRHIRATGNPIDKVIGLAAEVTIDELEAADEYEMELFRRVRVHLASGRDAWMYVP